MLPGTFLVYDKPMQPIFAFYKKYFAMSHIGSVVMAK